MQGTFRSPDCLLASFFMEQAPNGPGLFFLSGPSGAGKTTWCARLLALAHQRGLPAHGLISPPVWAAGQKIAIDLLDVHSGERRRLATARSAVAGDSQPSALDGPATRGWFFSPATLDWGNDKLLSLQRALRRPHAPDGGGLLLVDELGPLEFLHGQGLQAALTLLDAWQAGWACVAVRPSLLPLAQARWPAGRLIQIPERHTL